MPDQRGCNGKPLRPPSQPPHEYGPGIRPKDATDKEARTPRSRGRSVVVLYNGVRTHRSLNKDAPVSRPVQRSGIIGSHALFFVSDFITATFGFKFSVRTGVGKGGSALTLPPKPHPTQNRPGALVRPS